MLKVFCRVTAMTIVLFVQVNASHVSISTNELLEDIVINDDVCSENEIHSLQMDVYKENVQQPITMASVHDYTTLPYSQMPLPKNLQIRKHQPSLKYSYNVNITSPNAQKIKNRNIARASVTMEITSWIGMLVFLPDADKYVNKWTDPELKQWANDFEVEYTNNGNGFLVDYVFHPLLGATMYSYARNAGASYLSAFLIAATHNALWELKEYPHAGSFAAQDFVTTLAASGIAAAADCIGDAILDKHNSVPLKGLAYFLKAPSAGGMLLYKISLGLIEKKGS